MSTRNLAKKYNTSRQTIERRLKECNEREYKEIAKRKIAASIAEIAKEKEIPMSRSELSEQFVNGKSTRTLAGECNVSHQTIGRNLSKFNKEQYKTIARQNMLTGNTKDLPVSILEIFDKWENGEAPENLETLCGLSYRQILERLKTYDPVRYKAVAERRGLGSIRARQYGARSLFELNVKRILEKHGIQPKREAKLKFGKHIWYADFLLSDSKTIIEAMGLNFDWYWKRNKRKTRDYLRNGHWVIAVVPNEQIYQKARRYLSNKIVILRYNAFENFVSTSLKKVPNENDFPSKNGLSRELLHWELTPDFRMPPK
jgi:very-short-patch-repair endonuclease